MNDDQMDELLIQAARDYNKPDPTPREEMWAGISAARRDSAARRLGSSAARRNHRHIFVWPAVGVAAAALLAVGVMLGRRLERQSIAPITVAATPSHVKPSINDAKPAAQDTLRDTLEKAFRNEARKTDSAVRQLAAVSSSRAAEPSGSRVSSPDSRDPGSESRVPSPDKSLAFRLVVLRHLAGSEALITSFRSEAKRGEMDSQIAQWSHEMLSTTRLLEASAASDDPVMKRLLGDLDLIIAQIAVYAARGTNNSEELDLIEQSINQRGVIAKLRSTMPVSPDVRSATHM
jgi:hypothetical protein